MELKIRLIETAKPGAELDTYEAAAIDEYDRPLTLVWSGDYDKPQVFCYGVRLSVVPLIITTAECNIELVQKAAAMIRHGEVSHYIQSGQSQF